MISILAQERLLGAALGVAFAGAVVFEQRKRIYQHISEYHQSPFLDQSQMREHIFDKKAPLDLGHLWNKFVDQKVLPAIDSLSSSGS